MSESEQSDAPVETTAEQTPETTKPPARQAKKPRRRSGKGIALLALLLALAAGAGAVVLWYWGQQRLVVLSDRVEAVESSLQSDIRDTLMPQIKGLQSAQKRLDKQLEQSQQDIGALRSDLDHSRNQLRGLSQKVQGGQRRWALEDAESLLLTANRRLQLGHSARDAKTALQLANQRLGSLNDPRLFKIRKLIVDDIASVNALPDPDIEGLALSLGSLIRQIPDLPLATRVPDNYAGSGAQTGTTSQQNNAWQHFLGSVKQAVSGMLTIRRTDAGQQAMLPPDQEWFLYQNLLLKLQTARLALLAHDTQAYRGNLQAARNWLQNYFDTSAAAVAGAIKQIDQMRNVQLSWTPPDITDGLTALRKFMRGTDKSALPTDTPDAEPEKSSASGSNAAVPAGIDQQSTATVDRHAAGDGKDSV